MRYSSGMSRSPLPLVAWTEKGLYCASGDFYIDPHRSVETAVITHAHSDHARRGSKHYICSMSSVELLKCRLGQKISVQGVPFQQQVQLGEVRVSLHPAGHILGSAQVRIEYDGVVWVVSGDYKRESDPSCERFEVVPCDTFITEATFGTPKYVWDKNTSHGLEIIKWWKKNAAEGINSLLFGYSLGKAQRILAELFSLVDRPVLIDDSIAKLTECYRKEGYKLAPTLELSHLCVGRSLNGELLLAPPSILSTEWTRPLSEFKTAFASGWMQSSSYAHGTAYDHGFVISDHADWDDLNLTIDQTGATKIFVLHRGKGALVRHLRKRNKDAHPVSALIPKNYQKLAEPNLTLF